jgi:hypothetical protein
MKISTSEIIGKHVRDILARPIYEQRKKYIKAALAGEKVRFEDVYSHDGEEQYWENTLIPHQSEADITRPTEGRKISGYFCFCPKYYTKKTIRNCPTTKRVKVS